MTKLVQFDHNAFEVVKLFQLLSICSQNSQFCAWKFKML